MSVLSDLVVGLSSGKIEVVDLTAPLSAETPILNLPEPLGQTERFALREISRYDAAGPAWYWNNFSSGEHTGTHFDAPIHWITGRDLPENACDTIPARRFVGPACVLDVTAEVAADADFLLTRERVLAWEAEHGRIAPRSWVLVRSGWSSRCGGSAWRLGAAVPRAAGGARCGACQITASDPGRSFED